MQLKTIMDIASQWLYKKEIQAVSIPKYYLDFAEYNEGKLDKIAIFFMNLKNDVQ